MFPMQPDPQPLAESASLSSQSPSFVTDREQEMCGLCVGRTLSLDHPLSLSPVAFQSDSPFLEIVLFLYLSHFDLIPLSLPCALDPSEAENEDVESDECS